MRRDLATFAAIWGAAVVLVAVAGFRGCPCCTKLNQATNPLDVERHGTTRTDQTLRNMAPRPNRSEQGGPIHYDHAKPNATTMPGDKRPNDAKRNRTETRRPNRPETRQTRTTKRDTT
jgi:hypothetical protein